MADNTIETDEDNINAETIMAKIRARIRQRENGKFAKSCFIIPPDPHEENKNSQDHDLVKIQTSWDVQNTSYTIRSHRPFTGKILVWMRRLVNGEVGRYVDPVIARQTEFNASSARILTKIYQENTERDRKILQQHKDIIRMFSKQEQEISQRISELDRDLSRKILMQGEILGQKISEQEINLSSRISEQGNNMLQMISEHDKDLSRMFSERDHNLTGILSQRDETLSARILTDVDSCFHDFLSGIGRDLRSQIGLSRILEERIRHNLEQKVLLPEERSEGDINYFLFEERFRGTRDDIKKRQAAFLQYFEGSSCVLDIGCGRGEFLELLRENNIRGYGVDSDAEMVSYCRSHELNVVHSDALLYLENLDDESLEGIFIDQVVEHLESADAIRLLALCNRKLKSGYTIVVETVNPLSFTSLVNFYIDLSHKRPVHPETLQYFMNEVGFHVVERKFSLPVPDEYRLKKISDLSGSDERERETIKIYNGNVDIMNTILFGPQDYTVIAKK